MNDKTVSFMVVGCGGGKMVVIGDDIDCDAWAWEVQVVGDGAIIMTWNEKGRWGGDGGGRCQEGGRHNGRDGRKVAATEGWKGEGENL
jgi:hypothetical protein